MAFLFGLIVAIFGGVLPTLHFSEQGREHLTARAIIIGIVYLLIGWWMGWSCLPHFVAPYTGIFATLLIFAIISSLIAGLTSGEWPRVGATFPIIYLFIIIITGMVGCGMWRANDYKNLIGQVEDRQWTQDMEPIDLSHVILVSEEQAEWKGNQVLGQDKGAIGSRYYVGKYTIQKVQNELYWVAPLQFHDWNSWRVYRTSPGYIMVSAEDPNRQAELADNWHMAYMPSACFGNKLERVLYEGGYAWKGLTDWTFEVDDSLHPWWTVTVYHNTIGAGGEVVDGMVIVNPETGANTYYKVADIPKWVDRVYPPNFILRYIAWSGRYVHGFGNTITSFPFFGARRDMEQPTGIGIWMVYGSKDREPYWFTGITSVSSKDNALTGFMMVSSQTGQAYRYRLSGATEEAVMASVKQKVENFPTYHGVHPTLCNIYGELTWVVPVIAGTPVLTKVALVNAENAPQVFLGDNINEAARLYRSYLATAGSEYALTNNVQLLTINGIVWRKSVEPGPTEATYYLMLKNHLDQIFTATNEPSTMAISVTKEDDSVSISYVDTKEPQVAIQALTNYKLRLAPSTEQHQLDTRRDTVRTGQQTRGNVRDIERQLQGGNLSPDKAKAIKAILDQSDGKK